MQPLLSLLSSASYSPAALGHLPQPVPNHLPPGLDATVFTFEDAFEDLLAVSQGRSLPDLHTRYEQRKLLRHMFPSGEPTWFWIRRLESQGLVQNPACPSPSPSLWPDWESFHRELDSRAAEAWRTADDDDNSEQGTGNLWHQLGRVFRHLDRGLAGHGPRREETDSAGERHPPPEPDALDHLLSSLSSTFADGQQSWETFRKAMADHAETSGNTKQVETRDEYVDRFGHLHSVVTRKTLDQDGHEIGRQTYETIRPADDHLDNQPEDQLHHAESAPDKSGNTRTGWFWK